MERSIVEVHFPQGSTFLFYFSIGESPVFGCSVVWRGPFFARVLVSVLYSAGVEFFSGAVSPDFCSRLLGDMQDGLWTGRVARGAPRATARGRYRARESRNPGSTLEGSTVEGTAPGRMEWVRWRTSRSWVCVSPPPKE